MSNEQKIIKVFAICLAIFICISIFSAVISGIGLLFSFGDYDYQERHTSFETIDNREIDRLEIDISAVNLKIERGTEFKVDKVNLRSDINVKVSGTTLKINENNGHFWRNNTGTLIIQIPNYIELAEIDIDSGAGKVSLDDIRVRDFEIDHGAGTLDITNCTFEKAEIDGGVGRTSIEDSTLYDFDLSSGVGEVNIKAQLLGKSKIEGGIGAINLRILGSKENYTVLTEKGIGSVTIDGDSASSREGNGPHLIEVESGVGAVKINFN